MDLKQSFMVTDTYFETLSEVLEQVRVKASLLGFELDENEVWNSFSVGGVSYGQTKRKAIPLLKNGEKIIGKSGRLLNRAMIVCIYRMDSGRYELTAYKSW